ncbi:MAG: hypothetical protein NTU98_13300 [Bacteroidetes bacterium]|nr:hypothetical protein [Bacteroidota bacterium]
MTPDNPSINWIRSKAFHKTLIFDAGALAFVFFIPLLGNLLQLPFYMIEPMRLMVIISMAHFNRVNSFVLAFVLPAFSWIVSGHPEFIKMLVICAELSVNVFLFYFLLKKLDHVFLSAIASVIISKICCYSLYLIFFSVMFIQEEAGIPFLISQLITTILYSFYLSALFRKRSQ